ncbi:uroporphyrinogen-III C-methyltransferase [Spiractinospora alimapuensis]|uniref:uroporphyrinogen-III C-methyltransferase n=1 Tax=Spiractinospora alimapuensis TaxID=2820884 RepID=UPI001EEA1E34|nr:uroporphyrinogen-III C-methyltransferase [Spiractinospora alimapuensis]QVQ51901.1 uroporphyrinogen-III C-methyltransferase [Spiractinospora alimapuensis]
MTYLLGLRLEGRDVLVVGGGRVAGRRVPVLIDAGANVTVVSPEVTPALEGYAAAGRITWHRRTYEAQDVAARPWLVHAATDSTETNAAVAADAENAHVWCVRADDRHASAAWTPASGGSAGVTVGVVTDGDPRRAAGLRDAISDALSEGSLDARRTRDRQRGVAIVGGGPGDPGLITVRGRQLLSQADVVVTDRLAPTSLLDSLPAEVEVIDAAKIPYGRAMAQSEINRILVERGAESFVVRLKGGDPFVFGRGGEEAAACARAGIPVTIVPGVTSALAAPAAAGIPATHRGTVQDLHIVTAHVAPDDPRSTVDWRGLGRGSGTIVVLMGVERIDAVTRTLIDSGRAGDTAAAIIQEGTLPTQRTVVATLETVARRAAEEEIRPPAVLVVGDVVRTAHDLDILRALRSTGLPPASGGAAHAGAERATTADRGP